MRQYTQELWRLAGQLHRGDLSPESKVFIKGIVTLSERMEALVTALETSAQARPPAPEPIH